MSIVITVAVLSPCSRAQNAYKFYISKDKIKKFWDPRPHPTGEWDTHSPHPTPIDTIGRIGASVNSSIMCDVTPDLF